MIRKVPSLGQVKHLLEFQVRELARVCLIHPDKPVGNGDRGIEDRGRLAGTRHGPPPGHG
jgi:hypothetical protein